MSIASIQDVTPDVTSYDEVPYESSSFPQTHPDRLATLATLFGLKPVPVDRCSVLELGCGMGANLVPMAFNLPGSSFVGVDSSAREVAAARAMGADLGLRNVRIEHASILDVDAAWGQFDYVICHGVYSWVPDPVKQKILAIAATNLARDGVAFVSYNTYPGWHMREMIRRMMLYHAGRFEGTSERIEQARALIDFLAGAVDTTTYYGAFLRSELNLVNRVRDSYLFHEHLEEVNQPLYFHEFIARAGEHCLQYLAEADLPTMLTSGFPPETAATLERISSDIVHAEQYMDFLRNRSFRQTVLCHRQHGVKRRLEAGDMRGLLMASAVVPEAGEQGSVFFKTPDGRRVQTPFPLTQAALAVLGESWPLAIDQETLLSLAASRQRQAPAGEELARQWSVVMDDMLHCYCTGTLELRTWQPPLVNRVSERPEVSRMAACQARSGSLVTNQRHEPVTLDVVGRRLAPLLDGSRDRAALLSDLSSAVSSGELVLREDDTPLTQEEKAARVLNDALDRTLGRFARNALLVA